MLEYIFKNKSAWRTWDLQLILTSQSCLKNLKFASAWKVYKHTALQIALDVGSVCYTRVAKLHQYVRQYAYCLPSRRWQIQDFSGMIVTLISVVDPMHLAISEFFRL
jgi:hypothetical protein